MSTAISMRIYNTPSQSVTVYGKMYKLLEMSEKPTKKSPREINYTCNRNIKNIIYFASVCTLTRTHGEWISLLGRVNGALRDRVPPKWNPTSTTTAWKIIFHVSSYNAKNQPKCSTTKRKKNDVHDVFVSQCWWYGLSACLLLIRLLVMLFLHFKYLVGTW